MHAAPPATDSASVCSMARYTRACTVVKRRKGNKPTTTAQSLPCISHAIVMTDALNIYDRILKLKKMVLQRRAA